MTEKWNNTFIKIAKWKLQNKKENQKNHLQEHQPTCKEQKESLEQLSTACGFFLFIPSSTFIL